MYMKFIHASLHIFWYIYWNILFLIYESKCHVLQLCIINIYHYPSLSTLAPKVDRKITLPTSPSTLLLTFVHGRHITCDLYATLYLACILLKHVIIIFQTLPHNSVDKNETNRFLGIPAGMSVQEFQETRGLGRQQYAAVISLARSIKAQSLAPGHEVFD